jgi:TIR domain
LASVFISYRRDDTTQGWAAYLHERLRTRLGVDAFMDVDSIVLGREWEEHIETVLHGCDVVLVLIGRLWLSAADESGRPRLRDRRDVHRLEIAEALRQEFVRVIPVVFAPAHLPQAEDLPADIRGLVKRQACVWHQDEAAASQLQKIEAAVLLGPLRPRPTVPIAEPESGLPVPTHQTHGPRVGAALSAQVLALCAELVNEVEDQHTLEQVARIQRDLRQPVPGQLDVLGDAAQADAALETLTSLSYARPELRFIRDRVERLRDSGPDMQMIEVVKWYDRSAAGEVDLSRDQIDELARVVSSQSPAERLGLAPGATPADVSAAACHRALSWRAFEMSPLASPMAQRLASVVVRFYEGLSAADVQTERGTVNA